MTGLDLSAVKGTFETLILVDEVLVTRRVGGENEGELDPDTGVITPSAPTTLYAGRGAVLPLRGFSAVPDPNTARVLAETEANYRLFLPIEEDAEFRADDEVTVTAVGGHIPDPQLMSRTWEVVELPEVASLNVIRVVYLKQVGDVTDDPEP